MRQAIIEIRTPLEASDYNGIDICNAIVNKDYHSRDEVVNSLYEAGLPEKSLWNVRIYDIADYMYAVNHGDSFDFISFINVKFDIGVENRFV